MQDIEQLAKPGAFLFVVPHLDDEVLGFGTMLQRLSGRRTMHVLVSTCGDSLPLGGSAAGGPASEICAVRRAETSAALNKLGLSPEHLHFLDFSEFSVTDHESELADAVEALANKLKVAAIFAPFRYDQHADHLAVHRAAWTALNRLDLRPLLVEYFVYYNYPLLGGDIRRFLHKEKCAVIEPSNAESNIKREALRCFVSQNTLYYDGQVRPVLSDELLQSYANGPEFFVPSTTGAPVPAVLKLPGVVPAVAQWLQPRLKKFKERMRARSGASKG